VVLVSSVWLAQRVGFRIARSIRGLIGPATALGRREPVVVPSLPVAEAQELGRALENAARLLHDREEVLAIVSHDMRNPLGGLTMAATAAESMAAKLPDGAPVRALAASIGDISRQLSGMVDDLLAVAVSTSGGRSLLNVAPVNAAWLLERAAEAARPLFEREGVALQIEAAATLPDVRADADRMLRVFANLVDNALKFTARQGHVVLRAEAQPDTVRFCVANSGPALSGAEIEAMFRPFWQARPQDQRGAGLGLSICRSIIETHGGSISAEPEPGMRVRICFVLPRAVQ
jgi:signal transduction histidine kinase